MTGISHGNHQEGKDKPKKPILSPFKKFFVSYTPKEQMEISIFTLVGLIIMLIITTIYLAFFQDFTTFFRVLIVINGVFGVGFLYSMLLSTYSQYITLLTVNSAQDMMEKIKSIGELVNE